MDQNFTNRQHRISQPVNKARIVPFICRSLFVLFSFTFACPALAQHVNKCVNWQGKATYQSQPCPQGQRLDRVYSPTHVEVDGLAVRNFVPSTSAAAGGLAPTYGRPMNSNGAAKSDAACGFARTLTSGRGHRTIESLSGDAALRSAHCNHTRGPTD